MAMTRPDRKKPTHPGASTESTDLHMPPYLNGFFLTVAFVFVAFGMIIVVPPIVSEELYRNWPWPRYGMVIIALLCITMLSLVTLFHQQKFVQSSHARYETTKAAILEQAQHNLDRLFALSEFGHLMGTTADLQTLFDHITTSCGKVFDCHQSSLMVFDKDTQELVVKSVGGKGARQEALGARQKLGNGIAGWAAERGQALLLERNCDLNKYPGLKLKSTSINAAMVVPILVKDHLVGVINVSTRSPNVDYDEGDLKVLQVFGENIGAHIRHTQDITLLRHMIRELENALREAQGEAPVTGNDVLPSV